jgi:hypothetical protein
MGAQIDLIVISRILAPLRANILDGLQKMIMENKPRNWFCIYLCIFVLLHNCALMTQQDTAYAKKHGLKVLLISSQAGLPRFGNKELMRRPDTVCHDRPG